MAKPTGFMEYRREEVPYRPAAERVSDYFEISLPLPEEVLRRQAARCMDCGIPFCHGMGCSLGNRIPESSDLVYHGRWREACENLHATNNFPEVTGRVCPAPCEAACTLSINDEPVLIRQMELEIVERGFGEGWVQPCAAEEKTGRRVAVVGSGPAGLAAAQQLARAGHEVVVFEKDARVGGMLRYGIPDFKLDKAVIDRRLEQMAAEGVAFQTEVNIGEDVSPKYLRQRFDAVCLALGARQPRDLAVPGRGLENIHFAMDYLTQQNRVNAGEDLSREQPIDAAGKTVAIIGGGDTGSDCVGTAVRQGAREVHQFEILPRPPERANPQTPWPLWPNILRTSTSHEEGCLRRWGVLTRGFTGVGVRVRELHGCEVAWSQVDGNWRMSELPGTEFSMEVELVLLAMGFAHVVHRGLIERFGLELDATGNIAVDADCQTSQPGVFAAGDAVSGASLVVRAIAAGRDAAACIDRWLRGRQPAGRSR
ncbi:MAG: glutamate synthase [Phycisphaerae bacterium SM23_33]|nr:MAG: glutamate synthase [Phycisphaerae bacterium SM23_33]